MFGVHLHLKTFFFFFFYASKRLSVKLDVQIKAWMSWTTTEGPGPALLALTRGVIALLRCWNVTAALIPGGLFHQLIKAIGPLSRRQSTMTWYDTTLIKIEGARVDTHLTADVISGTYQDLICLLLICDVSGVFFFFFYCFLWSDGFKGIIWGSK